MTVAGGLFFPQRLVLKLDTHAYSRSILAKIVEAGGQLKSFALCERMLKRLAEVSISGRHVGRLTEEIGAELQQARDRATDDWVHYRARPRVESVPEAVSVAVDGGRINTREPGHGPGVHKQGWREDKVACLHTLHGPTFTEDPQPQPPACFLDHRYVADLVRELKSQNGLAGKELEKDLPSAGSAASPTPQTQGKAPWPPKRKVRTCVATQRNSDAFGPMVAAEADARNFAVAKRRAFLGDGQACNWTIQARWFKDYRAITDFIHPLAYVYLAAAAVTTTLQARWSNYAAWMTAIWQGRVAEVIATLKQCLPQQETCEVPATEMEDPYLAVKAAITYLTNNQSRMNYPDYRCEGLPITSCAVESLIKEFNYRVKGTEKFWNRPLGTERILQVRSALLSDDDRLDEHLAKRQGNAFHRPPKAAKPALAA